jgi:hypothetical protein
MSVRADGSWRHLGLVALLLLLMITKKSPGTDGRIQSDAGVAGAAERKGTVFARRSGASGAAYRLFLTRHFPRAFVLSVTGGFAVAEGGFDPLSRALELCGKAGIYCSPYAIDDQVVWTGGKEVPRDFARTVPAGQTSTLNFAYAVNPDCTSRGLAEIQINEAPAHGTAAVLIQNGHPTFPPGHPLSKCNVVTVSGVSVTCTRPPD